MTETKNAQPSIGRWYRVGETVMQHTKRDTFLIFEAEDGGEVCVSPVQWERYDGVVDLGTTGQRFAKSERWAVALLAATKANAESLEERIAALEARLLAPPAVAGTTASAFTAGLKTWEETIRGAARVIADEMQGRPIACHVDHDACSAEQRSGTGRAAQGTCVRGVVDLVAASADDQHAAERGTPAAGAEVTASEGGDTAQADSVVAELREVADMLAKADRLEREAEHVDPLDGAWRADLGYAAKTLRRDALLRITSWRERAVVGERRKWAVAIASALDGADRSGCESFVSCEEMAARVAAMRAELERERKLRRESEEAFKAASDPRSGVAQKRGLVTGARVRSLDHAGRVVVCGKIVGWDEDGDPEVEHVVAGRACTDAYYADLVELDTEATT